ncbi:ATP-binding protein [Sorangium sp. So ce1078]|uniref:sensor histidine kinase n=1 Tax=Sorangium sp. So ce1078 TaxID=3133329 RepID=UPI003F5ECB36
MRCRSWLFENGRKVSIGRFLSARLHRRIFMWFGATILITAFAAVATVGAIDRVGNSGWRHEHARAQSFVGYQFHRVWADPVARDALARVIAEDFDTDLELFDATGRPLGRYGQPCRTQPLVAPVRGERGQLGTVLLCPGRGRSGASLRLALPLLAVGVVLWAASGLISRRLARPLVDLAHVAHEIGAGKLSSRVRLDRHGHGEVGVVAEAVNDMAARIERQVADQRELLAAVSHELRTPLARIRLLTEMARGSGAPSAPVLDDLDREVMEIDALVGDLLASSRIDFAALTLTRLDPAETAIRALERAGLDPTLLEVAEGTPAFEADATLLARALANLLENARAHAGGAERLRVRPGGLSRVVFEVEDRGPGFAEEGEETRIFEPFFRRERVQGSESGAERGSLGLGLALCKRIAEAHGGRAFAERREGGGARVGIELALRPPANAARLPDRPRRA